MRRAALLLTIFLAGCSLSGGSASLQTGELEQLVLQPGDLPAVFVRFDQGRQAGADSPGGGRADPTRFGRKDGWKARYRRPGSARTAGPLVVESRVDLFDTSGGAEVDFETAREDLGRDELEWQPIDEPGLGDESFAATLVQRSAGTTGVRHYQVFWREDNATASILVNGFEGRLALEDVLELSRAQQGRIAEAAKS